MHVFSTLFRRHRGLRSTRTLFSALLLAVPAITLCAVDERIQNPQDATAIRTVPDIPDPSGSPAINHLGEIVERYRFVVDLDQDGDDDLLLSAAPEAFGSGGGYFWCFLNENGTYRPIGSIDGHPKAVALEPLYKRTRIWVYLHGSATSGVVGYYEIKDGALSEPRFIEINPEPLPGNLSNQIYTSIFQPPHLLTAEMSTTRGNGVTWGPLPF